MIQPRCLITDVTLFEVGEGRCKPADLFRFEGVFIVNASGEGLLRSPTSGEIVFMYSAARSRYFERRNVLIFAGSATEYLNQAAQAYIARSTL